MPLRVRADAIREYSSTVGNAFRPLGSDCVLLLGSCTSPSVRLPPQEGGGLSPVVLQGLPMSSSERPEDSSTARRRPDGYCEATDAASATATLAETSNSETEHTEARAVARKKKSAAARALAMARGESSVGDSAVSADSEDAAEENTESVAAARHQHNRAPAAPTDGSRSRSQSHQQSESEDAEESRIDRTYSARWAFVRYFRR